jgi:hypothetical protein
MHRQLAAFVEQPCKETFLAARDAVLRESPLRLLAADMAKLDLMHDGHEHEAVLDRIDALPPSKVLSPRIHFLSAEAAESLGHVADVELERSLFVLTLRGLLATGDGTRGNPYVVCHPTDEYDIVSALNEEPARQSLVEREGRLCDVILCESGRRLWFDVTDVLARSRTYRKQAARRRLRLRRPLRPSRTHR